MGLTLVLGGARSGKSAFAEGLAVRHGDAVRYVATASDGDAWMADRITAHQARRPPAWIVRVAGADLVGSALRDAGDDCVLVDGLGVWLAGRLFASGALEDDAPDSVAGPACDTLRSQIAALADGAASRAGATIVVSEEAGLGTLPASRTSRRWLDLMGDCNQLLAARASRAVLVVAGRPLALPPAATADPSPAGARLHGDQLVGPGVADHAVNVVAGGAPDWLREELHRAVDSDAGAYPSERDAVAALAARHGRLAEEVVTTNGATEALWLLGPALRPSLAACVHPAFTETEAALRAHRIPVVRVVRDPADNFPLDPAAVPADADLVVVGNPASPTGTLSPREALEALARPGRVIAVDEAFMDLVPGEPESLAGESLANTVVIRSATKWLGIPGLRAGYALAAPGLAARLRAVRPPWSANALALTALAAAARRPDAAAAAAGRAQRERGDLEERLKAVPGVKVWPGAANFCLVRVADGPATTARLRAARIAVRPCDDFVGLGPDYLRVTARTPEENLRVAEAIAA